MNEQKFAPVLSDDERISLLPTQDMDIAASVQKYANQHALNGMRKAEQAVLARVGAERDQALARLMPEVLASLKYHGQDVSLVADIENALKGTPAAAVAEPERVVMGLGKVAVGTCVRDTDGVPGIIYLRIPGDVREHGVSTSDIYPVGNAAPAGSVLACVYFLTAQTVQQSIDTLQTLLDDHFPDAPQSSGNPGPLAAVERAVLNLDRFKETSAEGGGVYETSDGDFVKLSEVVAAIAASKGNGNG